MRDGKILLTGATGYVGGSLLQPLESRGYAVRCLARSPDKLRGVVGPDTEVVRGDLLDPASLDRAMADIEQAFYLVHSMGDSGSFSEKERRAARNFAAAARRAGVRRVIYLGGLGGEEADSEHLESRHAVGRILRDAGVPTIEFRAAVVIGAGSLSFEMVRTLVERLPVMVIPRWVRVRTQPIAVEDVVRYLLAALELDIEGSHVFEIGGPDRVAYADLMKEYARQRHLHRLMVPVPLLSPWLSSLWLGLVTPLYARIGRALVESIKHETVVKDDAARRYFDIRPRSMREAIARAIEGRDIDVDAVASMAR